MNSKKRRKDKDNPYVINYDEDLNIYELSFVDNKGINQVVEITYEVYLAFDKFELEDLSNMNRYDRHIEHLEQTDESIYKRSVFEHIGIEEEVIQKLLYDDLKEAINKLPDIQKRRLMMYYFNNMTLEQIAVLENCTFRAIKFSIDVALKNLAIFIKNTKI